MTEGRLLSRWTLGLSLAALAQCGFVAGFLASEGQLAAGAMILALGVFASVGFSDANVMEVNPS
jgi:hypothetical protein